MTTIAACVIGYPVSHSRSPLIHGFWLAEHGIDGAYERAEVAPEDLARLRRAICRRDGLVGANVTVPHKEAAFRLAERRGPGRAGAGRREHAVARGRPPEGANTDVAGFLANLDAGAPGWDRRPRPCRRSSAPAARRAPCSTAVIERGAAARSASSTARRTGAEDLARDARAPRVRPAARRDAAGGSPGPACSSTRPRSAWPASRRSTSTSTRLAATPLVTDIVYVPLETDLLRRRARARQPHGRRPRHAAAPGRAGLRALVRRAARASRRASRPGRRRPRAPRPRRRRHEPSSSA